MFSWATWRISLTETNTTQGPSSRLGQIIQIQKIKLLKTRWFGVWRKMMNAPKITKMQTLYSSGYLFEQDKTLLHSKQNFERYWKNSENSKLSDRYSHPINIIVYYATVTILRSIIFYPPSVCPSSVER